MSGIRRAQWAALLVLASTAGPAAAAPPPYVVYEVYRAGGGNGRTEVAVTIEAANNGDTAIFAYTQLRPRNSRYESYKFGVVQFSSPHMTTRTYGWPAPAPVQICPPAPVCGQPGVPARVTTVKTFKPAPGDRVLVAGIRGAINVTTGDRSWRVRPIAVPLRVVTADRSDATGAFVAGANVEHFRSATSPAGRYGSAAFVDIPCATGSATLATDRGDGRRNFDCDAGLGMGFAETALGRSWTVEGDVVGNHGLPYRLVVLDYPRYTPGQ